MAAERTRTEAGLRQQRTAVTGTLNTCRRARGLQQRCSCYGQVQQRRAEVIRERQRLSNVMELSFLVMKGSVQDQNEDKKYWLAKLKQLNDMGDELSDYLGELTGHGRRLGLKAAGEEPVSPARCRSVAGKRVLAPRTPLTTAPGPPNRGRAVSPHTRRLGNPGPPGRGTQDIMAQVQAALRESYLESGRNLRDHAARVQRYNESKRKIRDALRRARGHVRASGRPCGPGAPPEIRQLCDGIAKLERRERELDLRQRRRR